MLFSTGSAGKLGLVSGGLIRAGLAVRLVFLLIALDLVFVVSLLSCIGRSFGLIDRRDLLRPMTLSAFSSSDVLLSRSISPRTVLPFVARCSSAMGTKRTTPRSDVTPSASVMNVCKRAEFRLLVVDWIWEGRAVRVRM